MTDHVAAEDVDEDHSADDGIASAAISNSIGAQAVALAVALNAARVDIVGA